jgi:hypothetical protein
MASDIIGVFASHRENRPRAPGFAGARSWSVPRLRGRLSADVDINHELRRTGRSRARNRSNGVLRSLRIAPPRTRRSGCSTGTARSSIKTGCINVILLPKAVPKYCPKV